jgi:hypothetical protein
LIGRIKICLELGTKKIKIERNLKVIIILMQGKASALDYGLNYQRTWIKDVTLGSIEIKIHHVRRSANKIAD